MAVNEVCNLPVSHSLSCLFRFSSCVCLGARLQGLLRGANFSSSLSKKLFLLMETNSRMWAWGTVVSVVLYVGQKSPGSPLDLWHLQLHPVAFQFPNKPFCSRSKSWNPSGLCCAVQLLWSLNIWFLTWFSLWKQIFKLLGKRKDGQWPFVQCWESQHWSLIPCIFYVKPRCKKKVGIKMGFKPVHLNCNPQHLH